MEYLKAVELIKEIEQKYDVMSIKCKNVSIWPYLRIYLMSAMATHGEQTISPSTIKLILSSLFFYNPFVIFKKYDLWLLNSCITRKKVGEKYVHHVSGFISQLGFKSLEYELPIPGVRHYPKKQIDEKHIVSSAWLVMACRGVAYLYKCRKLKIENEGLLKDILRTYNLSFDYKGALQRLLGGKKMIDWLFAITPKPRLIVLECAYTQMGMVWSAHNHGIPVIELQHGVLNTFHYGYNPTYHSRELYPDEMCVYGDIEYDFFNNQSKQYAEQISIMGMYMLECADKYFQQDLFAKYRDKYQKIVVVAGETGLEEMLSKFIDKVASGMPEFLFMYLPRRSETGLTFVSENVKYCYGVNIYDYLKWCDVHCTITSTTCLEAHYFHKPTIFFNFEGRSKGYYGKVLDNEHGGYYVDSVDEFVDYLRSIDNRNIQYKEIFAHNHEIRIKEIIDKYLK